MLGKLADKISVLLTEKNSLDFEAYNASRFIREKTHLCHAPFNNMYFNVHGQVAPCWLTLTSEDNIRQKTNFHSINGKIYLNRALHFVAIMVKTSR